MLRLLCIVYGTGRVYNIMEVAELFARLCFCIREVNVRENLAALYSSEKQLICGAMLFVNQYFKQNISCLQYKIARSSDRVIFRFWGEKKKKCNEFGKKINLLKNTPTESL